jgi:hypothetical protein
MRQNADPLASERSDASGAERDHAEPPQGALPLAVELVARLSAARTIGAQELPALIENVVTLVRDILNPAALPSAAVEATPAPAKRRRGRPPGSGKKRAEPRKKRGRPRKVPQFEAPSAAPAVPVVPRLIRRSEAVSPAQSAPAALELPPSSVLRGVVRWFDPARRTGGVRLTGLPEDVAVEPEVFAAANITRLFKGQEIEAEIRRRDGRVQVAALRVPGGGAATSSSGPIASTSGRRPRIVIVEKKLDALKRVAARSEAEHVLGSRANSKGKT